MRLAGDNLGSHAAHVPLEQHALVGVRVRGRIRVRLRFRIRLRLRHRLGLRLRFRRIWRLRLGLGRGLGLGRTWRVSWSASSWASRRCASTSSYS